jgi:hypothetical protein
MALGRAVKALTEAFLGTGVNNAPVATSDLSH